MRHFQIAVALGEALVALRWTWAGSRGELSPGFVIVSWAEVQASPVWLALWVSESGQQSKLAQDEAND